MSPNNDAPKTGQSMAENYSSSKPNTPAPQTNTPASPAYTPPPPPQASVPLDKHVWKMDDTYAGLAFKYYGSIQEPYWRLIYEHNKAIIGNNPNDVRVGLEIEIPPLPANLKKK